jgi:hypothetical protein
MARGKYDGALQMFVETDPPPVRLARLGFERWLLERGLGEHDPEGPPSGPLAGEPIREAAAA